MTDPNTGLVLIDKSNVVIKLDILIPPKPEHIQYTSSQPSDSSKHNFDSNHQDKTSEKTTDRSPEQKLFNQTSSQVQPKHKTFKKRAERILGIVLQNSIDEEHTLKESFKMQNSSLSQGPDPSERSSERDNPSIPATSTPNEEETSNITSEAEAMLEISEVTHGDVNAGHEIMEMRSTEQGADLKSDDKRFMTDEIQTSVTDLRDEHVKNSSIGERDDFQNLNQTFLRNTSDAFSQKNKIIEEKSLRGADERKDLTQAMLRRSVENTTETFSQEYFMGKFLNVTVDHNENFSDPLAETADVQNHVQILQNIYERDTNKTMDYELRLMEENPFCTFHNLQRTSVMFSLEGGHHQQNQLHVQNLCPNFLNTSETLYQEINQQFSNQRGSEVSPPFLGYHVEKANKLFADQEKPREQHLVDIWPNLLQSSVVNLVQEGEDKPSHTNHLQQTLHRYNMVTMNKSCDQENTLYEGNAKGGIDLLNPFSSVKDIRESFPEQSLLHKDDKEDLSSVLLIELVALNKNKCSETTEIKNLSLDLFQNIKENPDLVVDDLQNPGPLLFGVFDENPKEFIERENNEGLTSPSLDLHMQGQLPSGSLSTLHSEMSPQPPGYVSSTLPSLLSQAACSSPSRSSGRLSEINTVHAQICSSAQRFFRVKQSAELLRDAVSRIRRYTAPDSEPEEEDEEPWESEKNSEVAEEEPELEEKSGYTEISGEEEERHSGERRDENSDNNDDYDEEEDSLSSSSVDSQDTVIQNKDKMNFQKADEGEEEAGM
ncbi:hypothetical protein C0J50_8380 [Silurus asotus]|uniref:Uncharacterized protein n=1 Tax=Silurus asotus TaxID=30991 RepID=A0AAD5B2X8_SILAS|nr:hypothetical protein C0J50_8380 [Silurus asotus]